MFFKAAVLFNQKKDLKVIELAAPNKLRRGQVLVKLEFAGICGSQIGEYLGVKGKDNFLPHLLGHEGVGKVLAVGQNVTRVKKGDQALLHWKAAKGIDSVSPNFYFKKKKINAGKITAFSDLTIVSENRLSILPKNVDLKYGALLGCSFSTALGALEKLGKINSNVNVLIWGTGAIGLISVILLKYFSIKNIICVDFNKKNLYLAKKLGAKITLNPKKRNFFEELKFNIKKFDIDLVLETTGNKKAIENSYELTKKDSKIILVGVPNYKQKICINTLGINLGKKLIGCHGGDFSPDKDLKRYGKILMKNKKKINLIINKIIDLNSINYIFKEISAGKSFGKNLIKF